MQVQVTVVAIHDQGVLTLRLEGELDIATIGGCRARLHEAVAEGLRRRTAFAGQALTTVVLDLSELTFLSAAGLRLLSDLANALAKNDVATVLAVRPGGITERLARLGGLDRRMAIVDRPPAATASR
jgi:anti-anti-sigma factor